MSNNLTKAQLTDYSNRLPRIKQRGPFWCIPASIENMLKYAGIKNLSQEERVIRYTRKHGKNSLIIPYGSQVLTLDPSGMNDPDILKFAINAALAQANFDVFKSIVEDAGVLNSSNSELEFVHGLPDQTAYVNKVKDHIASQEPVLVASTNTDGSSHIRVVLAFDSDEFTFYDPALDQILTEPYNSFRFNDDMLVLKKRR